MVKYLPANAGDTRDVGLIPWSGKFLEGGNDNPLQIFLPGKLHGQRSLVGYSPWGHKESDMTEDSCKKLYLKNNVLIFLHKTRKLPSSYKHTFFGQYIII